MPTLPPFPGRRTGRRRNPEQVLPSAVSAPLGRTRVTLDIPSCTLVELDEYVGWLAAQLGISTTEARTTAVDAAIRRLVKTDPLWRKKARPARAAASPAAGPTPAADAKGGGTRAAMPATPDSDPFALDEPTVITGRAG